MYGLGLCERERGDACSCVRKFEEGRNGAAVAVACGFDILYITGEKKSSRGSSSDGGEDCEEKWRWNSYDAVLVGAVKEGNPARET